MFQVVNRVRGPFERFVRISQIFLAQWMNRLKQMYYEEDLLTQCYLIHIEFHQYRFRDGLKTLGILAKLQQHPEAFRSTFCHQPNQLTADILDDLFEIKWSEMGATKEQMRTE